MTTSYTAGTVSVSAGSTTVTGIGTAWKTANISPGYFGLADGQGPSVPAVSVTNDNEMELVVPWAGPTVTGAAYWLSYDTRDGQQTVNNAIRLSEYIARLDADSLSAIAALDPEADTFIMFTGANTAVLVPAGQIGGLFDAQVSDIAARAAYDDRPAGFRVLVSDSGDGIAAIYSRVTSSPGTWSDPAFVTGPRGASGDPGGFTTIQAGTVTTLPYGTPATVSFTPVSDGVVSLDLGIPAGEDGTGTGDVVGNGPAVIGHVAVYDNVDGKVIRDSGVVLGGSASLNVGTTAGTVAAGDDPRFNAGGQNEAILALEIADLKGQRLGMKGGVADAFDDETGVSVKTNAIYDAANDWYSPTTASQTTATGSSFASSGIFTLVCRQFSLSSGKILSHIGIFVPNSGSYTVKIVQRNTATNYTVIQSHTFSHGGGGWVDFRLPAPYTVPSSGSFYLAAVQPNSGTLNGVSIARTYYSGEAPLGSSSGWTEDTGSTLPLRSTYLADSMVLNSVSYTASYSPSIGSIAVQTVESVPISANTDLVARISRDGGLTWSTSVLALSNPVIGQRSYLATDVDLSSIGSGTSMRWEVSTANKSFSVSGVALQWR